MKAFVLMTGLIAASAAPAMAFLSIGIYADEAAVSCEISDPGGPGPKIFYIVHPNEPVPMGGSAWKLEWDAGMTMTWIGDETPYWHLGNAMDGITMTYVPCEGGTFKIDTVTMMSYGTSTPCSRLRLVPHPQLGLIISSCGGLTPVPFTPSDGIVNADDTCRCSLPTATMTWGGIKAMYR